MYYLLTALLLAYGIYTLAGQFITFPTKRTEKTMSSFKRKQSIGESFYTKAEVRTGYTVTNVLGTQGNIVALENVSSNATNSAFVTAANPISVNGLKTIFTNVALPGTAESPALHSFEIYVYGGYVNGVMCCPTIFLTTYRKRLLNELQKI